MAKFETLIVPRGLKENKDVKQNQICSQCLKLKNFKKGVKSLIVIVQLCIQEGHKPVIM